MGLTHRRLGNYNDYIRGIKLKAGIKVVPYARAFLGFFPQVRSLVSW